MNLIFYEFDSNEKGNSVDWINSGQIFNHQMNIMTQLFNCIFISNKRMRKKTLKHSLSHIDSSELFAWLNVITWRKLISDNFVISFDTLHMKYINRIVMCFCVMAWKKVANASKKISTNYHMFLASNATKI